MATTRRSSAKSKPRRETPGPRGRRDARVETAAEALALVEAARVITLVPAAGDRPSLVGAIVGGPVKGSWWSHPRGKLIYEVAVALEASGDVLVTKLVDGKVTFVHRALWPALIRVVTDARARAPRRKALSAPARTLLDKIERAGAVQCDGPADRAARKELELAGLVHATSEHTEHGHHAAVLTAWRSWAPADIAADAARLSLADARAALAAAGVTI